MPKGGMGKAPAIPGIGGMPGIPGIGSIPGGIGMPSMRGIPPGNVGKGASPLLFFSTAHCVDIICYQCNVLLATRFAKDLDLVRRQIHLSGGAACFLRVLELACHQRQPPSARPPWQHPVHQVLHCNALHLKNENISRLKTDQGRRVGRRPGWGYWRRPRRGRPEWRPVLYRPWYVPWEHGRQLRRQVSLASAAAATAAIVHLSHIEI